MKKILLLSTGGTIASRTAGNGFVPAAEAEDLLCLIPELKDLCEVRYATLMNLDSSNIQPEEWADMASAVFRALSVCDGVVITHGTDTMAYSSAALAYMLQNLNKPVIFTGAQIPIEEPDTDGKRNLKDAFSAAVDGRLAGVYIVFDGSIISGICAKKVYSKNRHAFESINRKSVGEIVEGVVSLYDTSERLIDGPLTLNANFDSSVLLVKLTPGSSSAILDAAVSLGYKAVVIEAFGLGGIPNVRRNLLPSIRRLTAQKIPVVVTTQCVYDGCDLGIYHVGVSAVEAGVVSAGNMTTEAAVVKLMWILGETTNFDQIIERFCKGEHGL